MDYRYERKFYIENIARQKVEAVIMGHRHCFSPMFEPRDINNIYFEFYNLQNFHDNVSGLPNRRKHRVRWYGDTFGDIEKPILEIKIKRGLLGAKLSYPVNPFTLDTRFEQRMMGPIFDSDEVPAILQGELATMKPMLLNSYRRSYFISRDGNYRATVDSKLRYYKILCRNNSFRQKCHVDNNIILELKYAENMDEGVDQITSSLPFRVSKSSKYVEGIERLFGVL